MLDVPSYGFSASKSKHNGKATVQADWLEGSLLFSVDALSRSDLVDVLIENYAYSSQDYANEWAGIVFNEVERRLHLLGAGSTLSREGNTIRRIREWQERPGYAFCLVLSLQTLYREQVEAACGVSYNDQGSLFERLCAESLQALDWEVIEVGWSKDNAGVSFESRVADLATTLGVAPILSGIEKWTPASTKDAGLDLVVWKEFPDGREGRPVCLFQCASGDDWPDKLHTPNLEMWKKLIDFATKPRNGLAMPFAPDATDFRMRSNHDTLMLLLDRCRLLGPGRDGASFPSSFLGADLVPWIEKRVAALPRSTK